MQDDVRQEGDRQFRDPRDAQQEDHLGEPVGSDTPETCAVTQSPCDARPRGREQTDAAKGNPQRQQQREGEHGLCDVMVGDPGSVEPAHQHDADDPQRQDRQHQVEHGDERAAARVADRTFGCHVLVLANLSTGSYLSRESDVPASPQRTACRKPA